ncbi:MAG: aspartate--tRNA ligase, partial [Methylococcales bacterium]|nr:aspartate--tRNA ligase [Methylococcales bacterium]
MLRTHTCGELRSTHIDQTVTLTGWVNKRRDMGGIIFIDLRDRYGKTQIVVNTGGSAEIFSTAGQIRPEYVLQVTGTVSARLPGQENTKMATGDIELHVTELKVLNSAKTPPILIARDGGEDESLRLKYRYLDLRREQMQRNMLVRYKAIKSIRDYLDGFDFIEIETPILFKSTPEGARDYLVPSRVHPGKFYALPQSPQQLKQLLMIGGYDRYFQIARCFRDEDQRSDRQPEFTQLDLEMSFVERADIINLMENLVVEMVEKASLLPLASKEFPRITYQEALAKYGTDRPDLRYGLELVDVADICGKTSFRVFTANVEAGNPIKALCVPGCGGYSRKQITELEGIAKENGAKGLAWLAIHPESEEIKGFISKFFTVEQLIALTDRLNAKPGDLILFSSDTKIVVNSVLDALRQEMARRLGYTNTNSLAFAWVVDFPLFEEEMAEGHYAPSHHMFTAPRPEDIPLLETDPSKALAAQYDLICNGFEVGGGSIRIHDRALQRKIMELIGFSISDAEEQF